VSFLVYSSVQKHTKIYNKKQTKITTNSTYLALFRTTYVSR